MATVLVKPLQLSRSAAHDFHLGNYHVHLPVVDFHRQRGDDLRVKTNPQLHRLRMHTLQEAILYYIILTT